ncbi:MAG: 30S ribosomal protein S16 [Planctomycetota bacterium]|nr:30S ribosomal protein S16 [Planctomycetota bacterium]
MGVRIRLQRQGRCNRPYFRIVVTDARVKQKGKCLEIVGYHDPLAKTEDVGTKVDLDKVRRWISVGAQCSKPVADILRRKGFILPARSRSSKKKKPETAGTAGGKEGAPAGSGTK